MQNSSNLKSQPAGPLIRGRYRAISRLGQGAQGTLHLAEDIQTGAKVAVKELNLEFVEEWKAIELFEREGTALESLDHPSIPDYVDAFHEADEGGTEKFYLVQEYMEGTPLSQRIEAGELFDEEQAREFLIEMLKTLDYLASLNPPVVHRDIKPSNIIVRPDDTFSLVDFGAVQTLVAETVGGSTVVGTTGFMPPEQLMGRATPASDIYGLGATVLKAMTGTDPADFEMVRMKLVFRDTLHASGAFATVLERMLEPDVGSRFQNAAEVVEALEDPSRLNSTNVTPEVAEDLELWQGVEPRLEELQRNPPTAPMSDVFVSRHELSISVGPLKPGTGNWFMYLIWMAAALFLPLLWSPILLIGGLVLAVGLTIAFRRNLSALTETLSVTADEITVTKTWDVPVFGRESETWRIDTDQAYLPHVYRLADQLEGGELKEDLRVGYEGLVFRSLDGVGATFGTVLLTGNRFVRSAGHDDDGELDWIESLVSEYMRYVRSEIDPAPKGGDDG